MGAESKGDLVHRESERQASSTPAQRGETGTQQSSSSSLDACNHTYTPLVLQLSIPSNPHYSRALSRPGMPQQLEPRYDAVMPSIRHWQGGVRV